MQNVVDINNIIIICLSIYIYIYIIMPLTELKICFYLIHLQITLQLIL